MRYRKTYLILGDLFIILLSFLLAILIKPASSSHLYYLKIDLIPFIVFLCIFVFFSMLFGKYVISDETTFNRIFIQIIKSNFVISATISFIIYFFQLFYLSRFIVFGTVLFSTVIEFLFFAIYFYWHELAKSQIVGDIDNIREFNGLNGIKVKPIDTASLESRLYEAKIAQRKVEKSKKADHVNLLNKDLIIEETGDKVYNFIDNHVNVTDYKNAVFSTTTRFNIIRQPADHFHSIINLRKINDIRRINKFFEAVNEKLPVGGIFIGCVEPKNLRKRRILQKYPPVLNSIVYTFDFFYKRVMPKLPYLKKVYFAINAGKNRVLSKQETYGRLYSCGFRLLNDSVIDRHLFFVAEKIKPPVYDNEPSYGPVFKMRRVGKEGKIIQVFKIRTMYPYSEYLQEYIYEKKGLENGGKFNKDVRITTLGKFMRKFWIDELPMIINLLRGDLKLVGVRPLSEHYLSLYTDELKEMRIKYKPGLIPPYYADMPSSFEEILESEKNYLLSYQKSPYITDFIYFFKSFYNIVFKHARSK
jgi:lipopolysaccharide/colanic/teichoic acid biosynthesis glycosyltransferase